MCFRAVLITMLAVLPFPQFIHADVVSAIGGNISAVPVPAAPLAGQAAPDAFMAGVNPGIKDPHYAFNSKYQVVSRAGKLYMSQFGMEKWTPVPKAPEGAAEISADGDNLIALTGGGTVHYMKFSTYEWTTKWGKPFSDTFHVPANRSWGIAHKGKEAGGFEDPAGHFIPVSVGVSTLYLLTADGLHIKYADPWLPANFNHRIAMPLRGCFVAETMSVSASTLFIIDKGGHMYTRLADFDTIGADPFLAYSFSAPRDAEKKQIIALPGEDWREQPAVPGRITARITIITTGRGNAGRELRVEGVNDSGEGGYYAKPIFGAAWAFVKTGAEVAGPFMDGEAVYGPPIDADYPVTYIDSPDDDVYYAQYLPENCVIAGFSPDNDSARIKVTVGGNVLTLPVYIRQSFFASGENKKPRLYGTIVVPKSVYDSSDKAVTAFYKKFLRKKKFLDVKVSFDGAKVELSTAYWRSLREHVAQLTGI